MKLKQKGDFIGYIVEFFEFDVLTNHSSSENINIYSVQNEIESFSEYEIRRKTRFDERIHENRGARASKTRNRNNRYAIDNVNLAMPISKIYNSKLLDTNKFKR